MNIQMTVTKIVSKEDGTFFAILQTKSHNTTVTEGLGETERDKQLTYYVPLTKLAAPKEQLEGRVINFNPDQYDIVVRDVPQEDGSTHHYKWCYAK